MKSARRCALAIGISASLSVAVSPADSQSVSPAPTDSPGRRVLDDFRRLAIRYQYDDLSDIDPWHELLLNLAQRTPFGSVIAGVNTARRRSKNGAQFELQAYPYLTARSYLALNAAWSGSSGIFLPFRVSAEPYYNFANGWETSIGLRYFQTSGPDVLFYTGTLAKYFGNHWLSGRPYFTGVSGDDSYGWEVTGRRYFSHRYDYISLMVSRSVGAAPEARDPQRFAQPGRLGGFLARIERRQPLGASRLRATYGAAYEREQIAPGTTRQHRMGTVGIEWFVP